MSLNSGVAQTSVGRRVDVGLGQPRLQMEHGERNSQDQKCEGGDGGGLGSSR